MFDEIMDTITEKQYKNIIHQHEELVDLIIEKAKQCIFIQYGRYPKGTCDETDFVERDGKLLVQFERYACGESDYEDCYLPLEFLFDAEYPEKYKVIFEEETRKKQNERIQREKEDQERKIKQLEEYDKREYERLKVKFAGEREHE